MYGSRIVISPVKWPEPARQTMQQGVETLFGSWGCLAEEDAGFARNAASRVRLAGISKFLQRIEQQHDNAFLRGNVPRLRERGSGDLPRHWPIPRYSLATLLIMSGVHGGS